MEYNLFGSFHGVLHLNKITTCKLIFDLFDLSNFVIKKFSVLNFCFFFLGGLNMPTMWCMKLLD